MNHEASGGIIMNLNRLINLIENKKHNEIYKLFSKSMKKSVSKRMLKETLNLYMKFAKSINCM